MKKHSKSRKIGTQGENAFRDFGARNNLVVTKADEDFGTDFFCVVESDPNSAGHSSVTGHVVVTLVRRAWVFSKLARGKSWLTLRNENGAILLAQIIAQLDKSTFDTIGVLSPSVINEDLRGRLSSLAL